MFKHHDYCKSFISIYWSSFHKIRHLWYDRDNYEHTRINLRWAQIKNSANHHQVIFPAIKGLVIEQSIQLLMIIANRLMYNYEKKKVLLLLFFYFVYF